VEKDKPSAELDIQRRIKRLERRGGDQVEQREKTTEDLLDERRKIENRVNENYGLLLRQYELINSIQIILAVWSGINAGILVIMFVLLSNLIRTL